jgi:hypothetical protein
MQLVNVLAAGCAAAAVWNPFITRELLFALTDGRLYSCVMPRVPLPQHAGSSAAAQSTSDDAEKGNDVRSGCNIHSPCQSGLLGGSSVAVKVVSAFETPEDVGVGAMSVACAGHARRCFLTLSHCLYSALVRLSGSSGVCCQVVALACSEVRTLSHHEAQCSPSASTFVWFNKKVQLSISTTGKIADGARLQFPCLETLAIGRNHES